MLHVFFKFTWYKNNMSFHWKWRYQHHGREYIRALESRNMILFAFFFFFFIPLNSSDEIGILNFNNKSKCSPLTNILQCKLIFHGQEQITPCMLT